LQLTLLSGAIRLPVGHQKPYLAMCNFVQTHPRPAGVRTGDGYCCPTGTGSQNNRRQCTVTAVIPMESARSSQIENRLTLIDAERESLESNSSTDFSLRDDR
jgi:hypothetical protein